MYNLGLIWIVAWIYACGPVSSGSWTEVRPRTGLKDSEVLVRASLTWLRQKREHDVVKSDEKVKSEAYSGDVSEFVYLDGVLCRKFEHLEPNSLTATTLS